jgi:hypothetical protein
LAICLSAIVSGFLIQTSPSNVVSINGDFTATEPSPSILSTSKTLLQSSTLVSLSTATAVSTSTKTITVTRAQSPVPKFSNSLSVKPSNELSEIPEKFKKGAAKSDEKSTKYVAEVLGDREILIHVPSGGKFTWRLCAMTKEAISINISRDAEAIETERIYSTDGGLVLRFPKKEAYGVLDITIRTAKKPRINETFKVEFGSSWKQEVKHLLNKFSSIVAIEKRAFKKDVSQIIAIVKNISEATNARLEKSKVHTYHIHESSEQFTKFVKELSMVLAKRSAIVSKEVGMQLVAVKSKLDSAVKGVKDLQDFNVQDSLRGYVLSAQVQSRLYWLKLQGKQAEYEQYAQRAAIDAHLKHLKEHAGKEKLRQQSKCKKLFPGKSC